MVSALCLDLQNAGSNLVNLTVVAQAQTPTKSSNYDIYVPIIIRATCLDFKWFMDFNENRLLLLSENGGTKTNHREA